MHLPATAAIVVIAIAGFLLYSNLPFGQPQPTSDKGFQAEMITEEASASATSSSIPTPTPTPEATIKPITSKTPAPKPSSTASSTPTATPAQTSSGSTSASPSSVSVTKKRSELNDLPVVKITIPGTKKLFIMPSDGTVGIYGEYKGEGTSFKEVNGSADIQIGFSTNYGIKTGENKVTLNLKEGGDIIEAANQSSAVLSIPVTITITD